MQLRGSNNKPINEAQEVLQEAFREHIARLYWLTYLITGDREQSVQSFGAALSVCEADGDSRKAVVVAEALKTIRTQLQESILRFDESLGDCAEVGTAVLSMAITPARLERALLAIDAFPRCAVLLTVFERFSDTEVSAILNVNERLLKLARSQGLLELTRNLTAAADQRQNVISEVFPSKKFCRASVN